MSRSLSRLQALLLGAVVLVGVGLGVFGLFAVGSRGWAGRDALHVRVGFDDVRGVEVGTRVRLQGLDAGEVVELTPPTEPGGKVTLRLRLKGAFRPLVRADARVQIVGEGMLGNKVLALQPGTGAPAAEDAELAALPSAELTDALDEVTRAVKGISNGQGPLGREVLDTVRQTRTAAASFQKTMQSAQQVTDAAKTLPWFRNYVKDQQALLIRANQECNHRVLTSGELFGPGGTSLTAGGEQRLDEQVPWLTGLLPHKGAELVVLAYADPRATPAGVAQTVTDRQSEAVCQYLTGHHAVHKTGWFTSRSVRPLGVGLERPVLPGLDDLPPAGVLLLVFVPRPAN